MKNPTVSLFVICYNHEKFLLKTLECARNQTYQDIELIILDDCSTDQSISIIDRWIAEHQVKCTFIKHAVNQGVVRSLNECIKVSSGAYISFIAADDLITTDKIERLIKVLKDTSEDVCLVHGDLNVINESDSVIHESFYSWYHNGLPIPNGNIFDYYLSKNAVHILGAVLKREAYNKVGYYDESLVYEDWDMGMRMARNFKVQFVPGLIGSYRKFEGQMTDIYWRDKKKHARVLASDFRMFAKHLDLPDYKERLLHKLKGIFLEQVKLNYLTWSQKIRYSFFLMNRIFNFEMFMLAVACLFNSPELGISINRKVLKAKRVFK